EKLLIAERAPTPPRRAGVNNSLPQSVTPSSSDGKVVKPTQSVSLFAPDRQAHPQISQPRPTAISTQQQSHQGTNSSSPSPRVTIIPSQSGGSIQQSSSGQSLPQARAKGPVKKRATNNEESKGKK
ncbi:MAG: hypothetical protein EZS28_020357, partial [Streblomastix strix]